MSAWTFSLSGTISRLCSEDLDQWGKLQRLSPLPQISGVLPLILCCLSSAYFSQPLREWISQADGLPGLYPSQNFEFSSLLPIPVNAGLSDHLHRSQFSPTSWKEHYWTEMSYCIWLPCANFLAKAIILLANRKYVTPVNASTPQSLTFRIAHKLWFFNFWKKKSKTWMSKLLYFISPRCQESVQCVHRKKFIRF